MWMTDYICAIKRELRDRYNFPPLPGSTENDPCLSVPDGTYPMTIDGKLDNVRIKDGKVFCCNFEP